MFTTVADVATAVHTVKGMYDACNFLYNAERIATPYTMGAML